MGAAPSSRPFNRKAHLENILESVVFADSPLGMAVFGRLNNRLVLVNDRLCRMLGYAAEELTRRKLLDITHIQDADKDLGLTAELFDGRIPDYRVEKRLIKKTGDALWTNFTAAVIRDESGKPQYALAMIEDITERKAAEELLRESEERFRAVADFAPDAVIVCRKSGTEVAFWNSAAEKIFGYSREEIVGKPLAWIIPEHLRAKHSEGVKRYLATGKGTYLGGMTEFSALRNDKSEFPIEISLGSWRGREGLSFTAIIRDITVRKRQEQLSEALNNINASINSTLDFEEIMSRVVVAVAAAIGAETTAINLREAGQWKVSHVSGPLKDRISGRFADDSALFAALAAGLRRPIVVSDALRDKRVTREFADTYGLRSFIVVPLIVRDEVIGFLSINYHSAPVDFSDAEIDFANKLGASILLAVENSKLYKAQHDIANILQEALTTIPERVPGVDIGYSYRSTTEAAWVGGDFYDIFDLERGKVGVLIGDVSGKGVEAANLTSIVKNTVKAYAFQGDRPGEVLGKTNSVISRASGPTDFVTLIYLVLDTQTGDFTYCNAGHPPPLINNQTDIRPLPAHALAAGVFPDIDFDEVTGRLGPGELLVLYTDGILEARHEGEFFGAERLRDTIRKTKSPGPAARAILDRVIEFSGDNLLDDIAILTVALAKSDLISALI